MPATWKSQGNLKISKLSEKSGYILQFVIPRKLGKSLEFYDFGFGHVMFIGPVLVIILTDIFSLSHLLLKIDRKGMLQNASISVLENRLCHLARREKGPQMSVLRSGKKILVREKVREFLLALSLATLLTL